MKPLDMDLRHRVVEARGEGQSSIEVAKRFKTTVRNVDRYWKKFRETGNFAPGQHGGHRQSRLKDHDDTLREWIKQQPDLTLAEMLERIDRELDIKIGQTALDFRLKKLGLTFKKNATGRRARTP